MSDTQVNLETLVDELKQRRDEIRVRLHLAKADLKDEWETLEKKWRHFERKAQDLGREARVTAGEVGAALHLAVDELRKGYARMRQQV